ncbi:MAG: YfiH family protein [Paraglaciecola sp.]|jgi:YfiH family protein
MGQLQFIQPNWPAPNNVRAYTTSRLGGKSKAPFDTLNVGQHVGDDKSIVDENRALLPNYQNIVWLQQIHGNRSIELSSDLVGLATPPIADASFSRRVKLTCAVMSADCLPVLICNKQGSCVAAIHAGWRSLASGIIENTLNQMACDVDQLMAWLGPAISQKHFEVGEIVKNSFYQHESAFMPVPESPSGELKFMADIYQIAREKLHRKGVEGVFGGEYCTYSQQQKFFSHRRSSHLHLQQLNNEKQVATVSSGRMVSCIYFE